MRNERPQRLDIILAETLDCGMTMNILTVDPYQLQSASGDAPYHIQRMLPAPMRAMGQPTRLSRWLEWRVRRQRLIQLA